MWKHFGVVRDGEKLTQGLSKISELENAAKDLDVRPDSEGFEDLMLAFDLDGSILSAKATILGAIERKESRGAHQRTDFTKLDDKFKVNFITKLNSNNELEISKKELEPVSPELKKIIETTDNIKNFEGKLLE